ncbi:isochorismatase family protein [Belnapia sp. T18]|uniref:Isochorismatase family protein n=1 Tax=Belnapia arida TaxID=2804533 RepID=A0ABS1UD71_9PROT|nr:isochorismatase family protein [Belnapia arida]MBL6082638.1 isochorismatase family protein [Belnapia arida]
MVTGCTTSICVESTVRDAMFRGYHCVVLEDCTGASIEAGLPRSNHEASLLAIQLLFGWVSDVGRFAEALDISAQLGRSHRRRY